MSLFAPVASARGKDKTQPEPQQPSPGEVSYFELNVGQFPGDVRFKATACKYDVEFYDSYFALVSTFSDASDGNTSSSDLSIEGCMKELASCVFAKSNLRLERTGIRFDHASVIPTGLTPPAGVSNYYMGPYMGPDFDAHFTGIGRFSSIIDSGLYPGIDLVFRFNSDGLLEFDLIVEAGADPGRFGLKPKGGAKVEIEPDETLVITDHRGAYA